MDANLRDRFEAFKQTIQNGTVFESVTDKNRNANTTPQMATRTQVHIDDDRLFQEKLAAAGRMIVSKPIEGGDEFKGFKNITSTLATKHSWKDDEPGKRPYYALDLIDWKDEGAVVGLIKKANRALNSILTKFTSQTALHIMQVAINLRDPENEPLFAKQSAALLELGKEKGEEDMSTVVIYNSNANSQISEGGDREDLTSAQQLLTCYCFIAASLIRIVTKSPDNYPRIAEHLRSNFYHFYTYDLMVTDFNPTSPALTGLKNALCNNEIMRHTLYTFLYSSEEKKTGEAIKMFLFKMHLQYTGLHAYVLFGKCVDVYKVEPLTLANAMNTPVFGATLRSLGKFFETFLQDKNDTTPLKMWRYARIFDQTFFAELQTRHTIKFVAVLAYMLKAEESTGKEGDVLKIARVAALPIEAKRIAQIHSVIIRKLIMQDGYVGPHAAVLELGV